MPSIHPFVLILAFIFAIGLFIWYISEGMKWLKKKDFYKNTSDFTQLVYSLLALILNSVIGFFGVALIFLLVIGLAQN